MKNSHPKPRLVFFQYKYDEKLPEFFLTHKREHVKCLAEFFDVTVINDDVDYQQICDTYQPDLTMFESGQNVLSCRRPQITNTHRCPEIPKLGFHNADAWAETRAGILSDMDRWGIETFFSISTTAVEHTPEISERLFVWPNFIDPEIYRDYGESKLIPALFTGSQGVQYPWRQRIFKLVSRHYPSLICPHGGYLARSGVGQTMYGEQYARSINGSRFVPTCGTVAKEVVRKHFEIPACKACLITEKSSGLEAAGFIDMENCLFVEQGDVLDKVDHLFNNPDELERITNAGYELVHARHTLKQRDQIFRWFYLQKNLSAGQRIVQINPFDPLVVVERSSGIRNSYVIGNGLHLQLLRQGDEKLWEGKYEEADVLYLRCLNYMRMLPEAKFRLALSNLYRGNAKVALSWIMAPIQYSLAEYHAADPDPVEWAYFIITLLCLGRKEEARRRASQFPLLRHPELDRTRWIIELLKEKGHLPPFRNGDTSKRRCSVQQLPNRNLEEWIEQLCLMLKACRQHALVEVLKKKLSSEILWSEQRKARSEAKTEAPVKQRQHFAKKWIKSSPFTRGERGTFGTFDSFSKRQLYRRLKSRLEKHVVDVLHRLEAKVGCFLPYYLSIMRNDEFFRAIQDLAREEDFKTALVIGAAVRKGTTEAFFAGIKENPHRPSVFCISGSRHRFTKLQKALVNNAAVKCYRMSSASPGPVLGELNKTLQKMKEENEISGFDVVVVDNAELNNKATVDAEIERELHGAKFSILHDTNTFFNYKNQEGLLGDPRYVLIGRNACLRNGYAIFKRSSAESVFAGEVTEANVYADKSAIDTTTLF